MILDSWASCFSHLGSEITDMGRHAWQVIHFTCTELEPNGWMCCPHTSGSAIKFEVQRGRLAGILSSRSHYLLASEPQSQLLADTEKAGRQWVYFTESISLILRAKHPSGTQRLLSSAPWSFDCFLSSPRRFVFTAISHRRPLTSWHHVNFAPEPDSKIELWAGNVCLFTLANPQCLMS